MKEHINQELRVKKPQTKMKDKWEENIMSNVLPRVTSEKLTTYVTNTSDTKT